MIMFKSLDQAKSHLSILRDIASCDDHMSVQEKSFIDNLVHFYEHSFGLSAEDLENSGGTLEENLEQFITDEESKWILIQDIISICHVDGNYCDDERERVYAISKILGLDTQKLQKLESLNEEFISINSQIAELIGLHID